LGGITKPFPFFFEKAEIPQLDFLVLLIKVMSGWTLQSVTKAFSQGAMGLLFTPIIFCLCLFVDINKTVTGETFDRGSEFQEYHYLLPVKETHSHTTHAHENPPRITESVQQLVYDGGIVDTENAHREQETRDYTYAQSHSHYTKPGSARIPYTKAYGLNSSPHGNHQNQSGASGGYKQPFRVIADGVKGTHKHLPGDHVSGGNPSLKYGNGAAAEVGHLDMAGRISQFVRKIFPYYSIKGIFST